MFTKLQRQGKGMVNAKEEEEERDDFHRQLSDPLIPMIAHGMASSTTLSSMVSLLAVN